MSCYTFSALTYYIIILYKSVHNIIAIDIDEHYANHEKRNFTTSKTSSISFAHPTIRKNCYSYSFMPRTVAGWNRLPATIREAPSVVTFMPRTVAEWNSLPATIREAPSVDTSKARLCSVKLYTHFTRCNIA